MIVNDKKILMGFKDKSIFEFPETWVKALKMKVGEKDFEKALQFLKQDTEMCWDKKIVRTKFGTENWGMKYVNISNLANDCIYTFIRPYVMGLAIESLSKKDGIPPIKIIAFGDESDAIIEGSKVRRGKGIGMKELIRKERKK